MLEQMQNGSDNVLTRTNTTSAAAVDGPKGDESAVMYERVDHASWNLSMLDAMRRQRTLCDIVLCVEQSTNIHAHQVVLACHSSFLMNIFLRAKASQSGSVDDELASVGTGRKGLYCRLSSGFDADSCSQLMDYMYSGKIWIGEKNAFALHSTASKLGVLPVVNACTQYLKERVNPFNVIGIIKLNANEELTQLALETLRSNYREVIRTKAFEELPHIEAEIRGQPPFIKCPKQLTCCVMSQLVSYYKSRNNSLADFAESTHRIYIDGRSQQGSMKMSSDDEVEASTINGRHFIDHDITNQEFIQGEPNHCVTTTRQNGGNSDFEILHVSANRASHLNGLASMDGEIISFTITIKSCLYSDNSSPSDNDMSGAISETSIPCTRENHRRMCEHIAQINADKVCLAQPRAGMALIVCEDKLLAAGGFNSGACLETVEVYSLETNSWSRWPPMKVRRGRCFAARINGKVGVFGGSDGAHHLRNAEVIDTDSHGWSILPDFKLPARHSVIVVGDNEEIYSVCGTDDGEANTSFYRYNFDGKCWNHMPRLKHERVNPTAVWHEGSLYVFGGNAKWRCLRTCEVYRPESESWVDLPDMSEPRRSAGIASYNGKIYLIGGTDGSITMSAVDVFDPSTMQWEKGPELKYRRSSPGVAVKDGLIYVVGGFDGQSFQRTTEVFDGSSWSVLQINTNQDETAGGCQDDDCQVPVFSNDGC